MGCLLFWTQGVCTCMLLQHSCSKDAEQHKPIFLHLCFLVSKLKPVKFNIIPVYHPPFFLLIFLGLWIIWHNCHVNSNFTCKKRLCCKNQKPFVCTHCKRHRSSSLNTREFTFSAKILHEFLDFWRKKSQNFAICCKIDKKSWN